MHYFISWNRSAGRYVRGDSQPGAILPQKTFIHVWRLPLVVITERGYATSTQSVGPGMWETSEHSRTCHAKIYCSGIRIILKNCRHRRSSENKIEGTLLQRRFTLEREPAPRRQILPERTFLPERFICKARQPDIFSSTFL